MNNRVIPIDDTRKIYDRYPGGKMPPSSLHENDDAHVAPPLPMAEVAPPGAEIDPPLGGVEFQRLLQENEQKIRAESPLRFYLIQSLLGCSAVLSQMALALQA